MKIVKYMWLIYFITANILATPLYPFTTTQQALQFTELLHDLRCLVCQNQDLADSNAPLAKDLRDEIYVMVNQGQSNNEIISYLTSRYGDFILFKPPFKCLTLFLWLGPLILLVIGFLIFWRICLYRK